jgi:hypothetical protein
LPPTIVVLNLIPASTRRLDLRQRKAKFSLSPFKTGFIVIRGGVNNLNYLIKEIFRCAQNDHSPSIQVLKWLVDSGIFVGAGKFGAAPGGRTGAIKDMHFFLQLFTILLMQK